MLYRNKTVKLMLNSTEQEVIKKYALSLKTSYQIAMRLMFKRGLEEVEKQQDEEKEEIEKQQDEEKKEIMENEQK